VSRRTQIFVPRDQEGLLASTIESGSAIVSAEVAAGEQTELGRALFDYQGAGRGAAGLERFADRVLHAVGRHHARYPTQARAYLPVEELVCIGEWDEEAGEVRLGGPEDLSRPDVRDRPEAYGRLAKWLMVAEITDGELLSSAARYQLRRDLITAEAQAGADPAMRHYLRRFAERHEIEL
jgi:hypothetical protein